MITQSGCFGGGSPEYDQIDDLDEAREAVEEIVATAAPATEQHATTTATAAGLRAIQVLLDTANRVRLLTWAVAAIALYLIIKELK